MFILFIYFDYALPFADIALIVQSVLIVAESPVCIADRQYASMLYNFVHFGVPYHYTFALYCLETRLVLTKHASSRDARLLNDLRHTD